jgi:hypothetical protein
MKQRSSLVGTLLIVTMMVAGWWFVSRQTTIASPADTLKSIVTAQPFPVKRTIRVEAHHDATWTFSPPAGKFPGRFYGRWTCEGKSAGIAGAQDDSLVVFNLIGPDNKPIQQMSHPIGGNFDIRIEGPSIFTFEFNNSGIVRSSSRVVELNGTYQPD